MKILIVLPDQPAATGNSITAQRLHAGLAHQGHRVRQLPVLPDSWHAVTQAIHTQQPDAALLLHAYRSGAPWIAAKSKIPFAVLLTGTDIHEGLHNAAQGPTIRAVLAQSGAILIQDARALVKFAQDFPEWSSQLHYLPPGIHLGSRPFALRNKVNATAQTVVFLHPAGIRPVKGNLELLQVFQPLTSEKIPYHLAFCGPVLDPDYGRRFFSKLLQCPWASHLGEIAPDAMPAAMRQADVILNNSRAEGLPNTLVEAASLGRPILATAISGNQEIVVEGVNGFCCATPEEMTTRARQLLQDPSLRQRLSQPDLQKFRPEQECTVLEQILSDLVKSAQS